MRKKTGMIFTFGLAAMSMLMSPQFFEAQMKEDGQKTQAPNWHELQKKVDQSQKLRKTHVTQEEREAAAKRATAIRERNLTNKDKGGTP